MKRAKTVAASKFKAQCLALLDTLEPRGLVVTKHGRPVARVVPYEHDMVEFIGCMRGRMEIRGDVFSTGERWDADAES